MAAKTTTQQEDSRKMDLPPEVREGKTRRTAKKATTTTNPPTKAPKKSTAKKKADPEPAKPAPQPEPEATATVTKPPGVSLKRGSTYVAGQLIAKHGLEAGCPKELVAELAAALGKEEKPQHGFDLRAAFHAIRGYLQAKGELPKELEAPAE